MHNYIFRIAESGETLVAAINYLMTSCDCIFTVTPEVNGFIYDVAFRTVESLEKFKLELATLLPPK